MSVSYKWVNWINISFLLVLWQQRFAILSEPQPYPRQLSFHPSKETYRAKYKLFPEAPILLQMEYKKVIELNTKSQAWNLYKHWLIAVSSNIYITWGCSQHRVTSEKSSFRPDLDFSCSSFEHSLTSFFFDIDWNHNLVIVLWIVSVLDCRCFIFERSIFWIWKLNPFLRCKRLLNILLCS